jgi:RES domain-containing protein
VWTLDVDLAGVADLAAPGALAHAGLRPLRPTQRQWATCQAVGEALWLDGAAGLLAPSAAQEGHRVLCVFRTAPEVSGVVEVPPPVTFDAIPVIPMGLRT